MNVLSPSASRVCDAAVGHFADHGYDASSLNEIAQLAGMRKASLYAHFANKDALFMTVLHRALAVETAFVESGPLEEVRQEMPPGHWLVLNLAQRYGESASLRFILRTAFLPPPSIRPSVTRAFEDYLQGVRDAFCKALCARYPWARPGSHHLEVYADAYLGIIDSLHVELMYADPTVYARRAASLLKILDDSLGLTDRSEGLRA